MDHPNPTPAAVGGLTLLSLIVVLGMTLAAEPSPSGHGEPRAAASDSTESNRPFSAQERADVERKVQAELDELQAGIQRLQARMDQMSADARQRAEASIQDLERRKEEARRKLEEIKAAGETTWARLRAGLESAMDDLKRRFDHMMPSGK